MAIVLAQMIVEAPKYGASSRAAEISAPRLEAPTVNTTARSASGRGRAPASAAVLGASRIARG